MSRLIPILLLSVLATGALAQELDIRYGDGSPLESDTDRFLREKVLPEIEAGDIAINKADIFYRHEVSHEKAIAHYLKALVEIEKEKLRRESR